jgi:hypothetical protein
VTSRPSGSTGRCGLAIKRKAEKEDQHKDMTECIRSFLSDSLLVSLCCCRTHTYTQQEEQQQAAAKKERENDEVISGEEMPDTHILVF